nr:4Fe-4S ferredoxin N-terminal domain-containing protein [Halapricum salinum]
MPTPTNDIEADSIDDLGADWEETTEAMLEGSTHDTELGRMMGRDAIRVSIGKMTEAEFHEKYHEAVVEEFGVDDRPTEPEGFDE